MRRPGSICPNLMGPQLIEAGSAQPTEDQPADGPSEPAEPDEADTGTPAEPPREQSESVPVGSRDADSRAKLSPELPATVSVGLQDGDSVAEPPLQQQAPEPQRKKQKKPGKDSSKARKSSATAELSALGSPQTMPGIAGTPAERRAPSQQKQPGKGSGKAQKSGTSAQPSPELQAQQHQPGNGSGEAGKSGTLAASSPELKAADPQHEKPGKDSGKACKPKPEGPRRAGPARAARPAPSPAGAASVALFCVSSARCTEPVGCWSTSAACLRQVTSVALPILWCSSHLP